MNRLMNGQKFPALELPKVGGGLLKLPEALAGSFGVVLVYRGDWCPFCNIELRALQAIAPELHDLGATIVAVSPQRPDRDTTSSVTAELGFDVLSDVDQSVIAAYQLLYEIDDATRDLLENTFHNNIAAHNADGTWRLPIPATFVLDEHGVVRDRHVDADYRTRMEPADITAAVRQIVAARAR